MTPDDLTRCRGEWDAIGTFSSDCYRSEWARRWAGVLMQAASEALEAGTQQAASSGVVRGGQWPGSIAKPFVERFADRLTDQG